MENRKYFYLGTFFMIILFAVLSFVVVRDLIPAIANILMMLVGLFAMASLSAFHRVIETGKTHPLINIMFNEQVVSSQLDTAAERIRKDIIDAEIFDREPEPWDVEAEDLLGKDNSLALAKLRIDIEKELRQIARFSGMELTLSRYGIRDLTEELSNREILDQAIMAVIDDILPVANQAIHGRKVSTDTAATILRLGRKLLALLKATYADKKK